MNDCCCSAALYQFKHFKSYLKFALEYSSTQGKAVDKAETVAFPVVNQCISAVETSKTSKQKYRHIESKTGGAEESI